MQVFHISLFLRIMHITIFNMLLEFNLILEKVILMVMVSQTKKIIALTSLV